MKKIFLIIAIVIMISIILYSAFAFATWEMNPKYWDSFLRGIFAFLLIVIMIFCGIGVYCEIKN